MKATQWRKLLSLSFSEVWFLVKAAAGCLGEDGALREAKGG